MSKMIIIEGNSNDKDNTRNHMVKGEKGDPGVSPTFETSKTGHTATITIIDVNGTHTVELEDGETYEVPTGSVIGFDGDTIPAGYEEIDTKQFQIIDRNDTVFEFIIPKPGLNNIKHALVTSLQWHGIVSVGNSEQLWVRKIINSDSVEASATQVERTSTYTKIQLTFTATQFGGIEVICPYIN